MREFNQEAYDACDAAAREAVAKKLRSHGYEVIDNGEDYKVDLKTNDGWVHELEVRQIWGEVFPYDTIHIPFRKFKVLRDNEKVYFWTLNKELTKAMVISGDKVKDHVDLLANGNMERFFDVPVEDACEVDL